MTSRAGACTTRIPAAGRAADGTADGRCPRAGRLRAPLAASLVAGLAAALATALAAGCSATPTATALVPAAPPAAVPAADSPRDPLPSWRDSASRRAIVAFVERVTTPGPDFLPERERVAVFDNDGTLWAEQPLVSQAWFIFDRIRRMAPAHPEWQTEEPFASVLAGRDRRALAGGELSLIRLSVAALGGTRVGEYEDDVRRWMETARHPATGRRYTEMTYQPMLELLAFLRSRGFRTWMVSGASVEFLRPWVEETYGIPPEQVIGSSVRTRFVRVDGKPVLERAGEISFTNDRAGKPVGIQSRIGRHPVMAFGNSDSDLEMLEWTCDGSPRRFCAFVHHTDGKREWRYDDKTVFGRLKRGLDEAARRGWTLVDMAADWEEVFPPER